MRAALVAIVSLLLIATVPARAEFKPPEDGVITEDQLNRYLATMKEIGDLYKAAGKAAEGQGAVAAMGLWARTNEKYQAILAKNKLSDDEFTWLGGQVSGAWIQAMMQLNWEKKAEPAMVEQEKKLKADIELQKTKLAEYEKAAKAGTRVLDADTRKATIERAKEEMDAAKENLAAAEQEIKDQKKLIADKETEAKQAEELAKKPPADVAAEDRADYIQGKNDEAASFRQEAKDLKEALVDKETTRKEYAEALAAAKKKMESPEAVTNDEEKATIKAENEAGIKSAREQIKATEDGLALLIESRESAKKQMAEIGKDVPKQNVELLKKHFNAFCEAVGMRNEFAEQTK